jgi:hypothetical protein
MKIKENIKEYVCCYGHRFLGRDVKLVPFRNESEQLTGKLLFAVSEDEEFYQGGRPKTGYLLACPHCGIVQLGGFLCPSDKQLVAGDTADKRNIQLHL